MINQIKRLPLTSDIVFKRVFSKAGNEDLLKSLLEAILDTHITNVVIKNPELPPNLYDSKAGVLDIKVEIDNHTLCDIEMQVKPQKMLDRRSLFYLSRLVSDELKKGEHYEEVKKTIAINILDFEYFERNGYHHIAHMKFDKTKEDRKIDLGYLNEDELATDYLELHYIELPKFVKKDPDTITNLEQWLWLFADRRDKLEMAKELNKHVKKAMEIIDEMSMDEKEWELYRSREMAIMDYEVNMSASRKEGKKEGLEEGKILGEKTGKEIGKKEEKLEIAKELLKLGISIDDIQKATKLTKNEIENLRSQE